LAIVFKIKAFDKHEIKVKIDILRWGQLKKSVKKVTFYFRSKKS